MDQQQKVASFIEENEMDSPPAYRLLDLASELGEVAKDVVTSTDYGKHPEELEISSGEIGDMLFSLLALADTVGIDADDALDEALTKYEERLTDHGTAASDTSG